MATVFVYGTLRKGGGNHHLLTNSKYLGTYRECIGMDMVDLGAFPGLIMYKGDFPLPVTLEAYEVDKETLERLDWLEGYPSFYNRKEVEVGSIKGYVYYLEEEYSSKPLINNGDWLEYIS